MKATPNNVLIIGRRRKNRRYFFGAGRVSEVHRRGEPGEYLQFACYWLNFRQTAPASPRAPIPAMARDEGSGTLTTGVAADASEQSTNMQTASVNRRTRISSPLTELSCRWLACTICGF